MTAEDKTNEEIRESLCYYVQEGVERDPKDKECYCDNCFRGKHELAQEILRLRYENEQLQYKLDNSDYYQG